MKRTEMTIEWSRERDPFEYDSLSKMKKNLDNAEEIFSKEINNLYFRFCDALKEIDNLKTQVAKLQVENAFLKKSRKDADANNMDDIYNELKLLRREKINFEKKLNETINKVQEHYSDDLK